ncbi:MAG: hypothetical protein JSU00_13970 [Acidobacteria bacterium]|nr:hypothetical protein [Acidobacteriota bacterium]
MRKTPKGPAKNGTLPEELESFTRSTQRLTSLRERLRKDIEDYQHAYTAKLAAFDQERAQINDTTTQRTITNLRRHTEDDLRERLENANATLEALDRWPLFSIPRKSPFTPLTTEISVTLSTTSEIHSPRVSRHPR